MASLCVDGEPWSTIDSASVERASDSLRRNAAGHRARPGACRAITRCGCGCRPETISTMPRRWQRSGSVFSACTPLASIDRHQPHAQDEHPGGDEELVEHVVQPVGRAEEQRPVIWKTSTPFGSSARWSHWRRGPASSSSPFSSSRRTPELTSTASAMRYMKTKAATTTPTSIATVRSKNTVSKKVSSSTSRSPHRRRQRVAEVLVLAHVPGHDQQHRGQRGQRHVAHQRRQQQHEQQQEHRVQHARDRRTRAGAHVGRGARDRAGRGQAAEQRRADVGDALRDQFAVGAMAAADHAVGDDRRQQRFDAGEERDGEGGGQQFEGALERDVREVEGRQRRGQAAEAAADGFDRQRETDADRRADHQRDQEAGPVRFPAPQRR